MPKVVSITVTDEMGRPARLDDIRWQFKLNEFVSELKAASPVGEHTHDQGIDFINDRLADGRYLPRVPGEQGSLKRHWRLGSPGVRGLKSGGKTVGIQVDSTLPHSRIIDEGGSVPPVSGKGMHWRADSGDEVLTDRRGGFLIEGQHYVDKATDKFFDKVANCKVEWA